MRLLKFGFLLTLAIWSVLPLIPLAIWSVARGWNYPALLPNNWSLQAWQTTAAAHTGIYASFGESILVAATTTLIALLVGVPAGRAIGLYNFRAKSAVAMFLFAPLLVPGIAIVLGLHPLFIGFGLTGTTIGVILAHLVPTVPYVIFVMSGIFAGFDRNYEDQARSLGASNAQVFWIVTFPMILPGVLTSALFAFLISWGQYVLTLVIGGGKIITVPLLMFGFAAAGRHDLTGAISMLYILPGIILLLMISRHVSGRNKNINYLAQP